MTFGFILVAGGGGPAQAPVTRRRRVPPFNLHTRAPPNARPCSPSCQVPRCGYYLLHCIQIHVFFTRDVRAELLRGNRGQRAPASPVSESSAPVSIAASGGWTLGPSGDPPHTGGLSLLTSCPSSFRKGAMRPHPLHPLAVVSLASHWPFGRENLGRA